MVNFQCASTPEAKRNEKPVFIDRTPHKAYIRRGRRDDNFLRYDGTGELPSQIHRYLSTNYHDLRSLEKSDPRLVAKAQDRWYPATLALP